MINGEGRALDRSDRPDGLLLVELEVLRGLLEAARPTAVLEIGMANGSSTVAILDSIKSSTEARLVSIDPYQLAPQAPAVPGGIRGYAGAGLEAVRQSGHQDRHELIAEPDYLALPKLVSSGRTFDFIFIDGYHSFDYALVDFFFADLLLRVGGTVVLHDSNRPTVFRVCEFINHNKGYRMIGPPLMLHPVGLARRALRRGLHVLTGRTAQYQLRSERWKSLAAFVKDQDVLADEVQLHGM